MVPVANRIVHDLDGTSSKSASVLLVTIWELGEAAGPLVVAPLSELPFLGRYAVFNVANVLLILATVLAALSRSTALFIAARALTGLAVASNVLNPAIVGDMFVPEERGSAMSAIMLAPLIGGAVGPAIAGAIAETLGWRQVLWMAVILASACELAFLTCFRETYSVAILSRRASKLRIETGNASLRTVFEAEEDQSSSRFWNSILRPFVVFSDSGVLQAMSLFGALAFTYFYVMTTTLPDILEGIYGLSPSLTGSSFIIFSTSFEPLTISFKPPREKSVPLLTCLHRHWLSVECSDLQHWPGQNLCQASRCQQRCWSTRISTPDCNRWRLFLTSGCCNVRLGC